MPRKMQTVQVKKRQKSYRAGELSGDTLESKFLALEQGGANEDDALAELKSKMGMLAAPKDGDAKQLGAGAPMAAKDEKSASAPIPSGSVGGLSAEDLKELEDLDLSELETPSKDVPHTSQTSQTSQTSKTAKKA